MLLSSIPKNLKILWILTELKFFEIPVFYTLVFLDNLFAYKEYLENEYYCYLESIILEQF